MSISRSKSKIVESGAECDDCSASVKRLYTIASFVYWIDDNKTLCKTLYEDGKCLTYITRLLPELSTEKIKAGNY